MAGRQEGDRLRLPGRSQGEQEEIGGCQASGSCRRGSGRPPTSPQVQGSPWRPAGARPLPSRPQPSGRSPGLRDGPRRRRSAPSGDQVGPQSSWGSKVSLRLVPPPRRGARCRGSSPTPPGRPPRFSRRATGRAGVERGLTRVPSSRPARSNHVSCCGSEGSLDARPGLRSRRPRTAAQPGDPRRPRHLRRGPEGLARELQPPRVERLGHQRPVLDEEQ